MNRADIKTAADLIGRVEALTKALDDAKACEEMGAFRVRFWAPEKEDVYGERYNDVYYPREPYIMLLETAIGATEAALKMLGAGE